ncbi:MAG: alkyl sulfatase BDS1-like metallo-beta-lactamase superfamily hydrolase [Bradymonadia bacterium]|jgi:alkyl sulfatase BDS1-like metallo-beta-lactamase superfamily hydrolase
MRWLVIVAMLWGCDDGGGAPVRLDAAVPCDAQVVALQDATSQDAARAVDGAPVDMLAADAGPIVERLPPAGPAIQDHCDAHIGEARVEEVAPDLFVAIGYDLANTILLRTDAGNVVIDVSMSPARAEVVRAALMQVAPGPTLAIIYTHSHIDHVGGASVWAEEGTQIWATEALLPNLLKQYGAFRDIESFRGTLQFGDHLDDEALPCSAIGRKADVTAALTTGVRVPTHTFTGETTIEIGGAVIELVEAPGETHDQLFVWLPEKGALMPGDNHYAAFPNLYTIRGTTARPVDDWIDSLDAMRARDPAILVPSHTAPVINQAEVRERLTTYRDGIQWLRDAVVRGANQRLNVDELAAQVRLPAHLAGRATLDELYGQVDWSVRAIYNNALGWFDGRTERLYPANDAVAREVRMMGGVADVLSAARAALDRGDARWAAHLLGKLRDAKLGDLAEVEALQAQAYRVIADGLPNTNGRAYLMETARGLEQGFDPPGMLTLDDAFIDQLPIDVIFAVMPSRLKAAAAIDVHETLALVLTDLDARYHLTVRRGVLEVVRGEPLPGTPAPSVVLTTTSNTWKRMTLGTLQPLEALSQDLLEASDLPAAVRFLALFNAGA